MEPKTRAALIELNRAFYTRFAREFAQTRQSWPPGFRSILPYLQPAFNLLDLGCGNARLLHFLYAQGWRGHYTGLDGSAELLALAEGSAQHLAGLQPRFVRADLAEEDWGACLDLHGGHEAARPDAVAALAVLHHIPGARQRAGFLAQVAGIAKGVLVVSTWQFLAPRLRTHILPWQAAGLSPEAVEPGDYLLSWGQGAAGQRYCAFIGEEALAVLAASAGMQLIETFYADGHEGNLNLYGVLRRGSRE